MTMEVLEPGVAWWYKACGDSFFPKEQETHKRELKGCIKNFSKLFYEMYKFKTLDKLF